MHKPNKEFFFNRFYYPEEDVATADVCVCAVRWRFWVQVSMSVNVCNQCIHLLKVKQKFTVTSDLIIKNLFQYS